MSTLFNKKIHKWVSLFVGLQLIIWLGTGLYFKLMDHDKSTGNINRKPIAVTAQLSDFELFPVAQLQTPFLQQLTLIWIQNHPYYLAIIEQQAHSYQRQKSILFDASTGQRHQLNEAVVADIAQSSYKGNAEFSSIQLLSPPIDELANQQNKVWRVDVVDEYNTSIYVSNISGRIVSHVTDDKRLRDLMFKLHFMDYGNEGHFNNWQIVLFAILALLLSITGAIWVYQLIMQKGYVVNLIKRRKKIRVQLGNADGESHFKMSSKSTVLDGLADVGVLLPSNCGGGGMCGRCKFTGNQSLPISSSENTLLTIDELNQGIRLGCQQRINAVESIRVEEP